jgi:hypothetical protein
LQFWATRPIEANFAPLFWHGKRNHPRDRRKPPNSGLQQTPPSRSLGRRS